MVIRITVALFLALTLLCPNVTRAASGAPGPGLSFTQVPGYRIAVKGTGWPSRARLHFLARTPGGLDSVRLQATRRGFFLVGINGVDLCGGSSFEVVDTYDHHVVLRSPQMQCSFQLRSPRPILTVLRGTHLPQVRVSLFGPSLSRVPVTVNVGDSIYIWQPGGDHPVFWPRVDSGFLQWKNRGRTLNQDCSGMPAATPADCSAGFYWEWIAAHAGNTVIDLLPSCRHSRQTCGLHDVSLEVRIDD